MKKFIFVLFMLLAASPAKAETLYCTEMWCQEGLSMMFKDGASWPKGEYTFDIMADDSHVVCKGSLPFKTCDGSVICDGADIKIGESGCALPEDQHYFNSILAQQAPKHLTFTITRPDGKKFSYDGDIEQTCGFPNGEQCDLRQCCSAVVESEVKWE